MYFFFFFTPTWLELKILILALPNTETPKSGKRSTTFTTSIIVQYMLCRVVEK